MRTIAILTSGGDAPGMNAAIRAVVRAASYYDMKVYGIKNGYSGLTEGNLELMGVSSVADIIQRGGTILGTARSKEFLTEEGQQRALNVLDIYGIEGLIVLGGDGTFRGAKALSEKGFPVIGIPCTIDNDLGYSEYTIGFFTAVETAVDAIGKIRDTSSSHGRASVIEVMGRHCGDIALYSGLAGGAESIILPEIYTDMDQVLQKVLQGRNRGKRQNLIIMAEGTGDPYEVAETIRMKTNIETRVTILGHIQRGGTPIAIDRIIASEMGIVAVEKLRDRDINILLGIRNNNIYTIPIDKGLLCGKSIKKGLYNTVGILSI
ncbi:MAG: 6-phosphofructokinase [Tissierellia bacterium]|nr:6-phosphofructokinase [Tissierellia bacterium]